MSRKLFRLGLDPASYNPVGLRSYSTEVLQEEYKRIQTEARARLESLRKSEYGRASEIYQRNKGRYPALSRIQDRRQLERAIQEGARFLASPRSTASGQMEIAKKQLETLDKHGYSWVTRPMIRAWGEYLNWLGDNAGKELYYSRPKDEETTPNDKKPSADNSAAPEETQDKKAVEPETQKELFYQWAQANGYLSYKTVTYRGREVEREVWEK